MNLPKPSATCMTNPPPDFRLITAVHLPAGYEVCVIPYAAAEVPQPNLVLYIQLKLLCLNQVTLWKIEKMAFLFASAEKHGIRHPVRTQLPHPAEVINSQPLLHPLQ